MTEATDTNPDLFPMGDFAGSGFDVGYPYGGEQSEPFLMTPGLIHLKQWGTNWTTGMLRQ